MSPKLDREGFLANLDDWSEAVAEELAHAEGVVLEDAHWLVIDALRQFYVNTEVSPAMRAFVNMVKNELGVELGSSISLMRLFGSSPAKTAAKIAGLPRPTNCL